MAIAILVYLVIGVVLATVSVIPVKSLNFVAQFTRYFYNGSHRTVR